MSTKAGTYYTHIMAVYTRGDQKVLDLTYF